MLEYRTNEPTFYLMWFQCVWCIHFMVCLKASVCIEEFKVVALLRLQRGVWEKIFPTSARLDFKLLAKLEDL